MKNFKFKILFFILLITHINVYAQYYFNQAYYQQITVYTPNGTPVTAYSLVSGDYSSNKKRELKNYWLNRYNNRIKYLGEATKKYNCHTHAWHLSEGGGEVWINSPGDDIYWNDYSYAQVSNQLQATKVSFASDDHSAITTGTTDVFISKWGPSPLFRHSKNDCPYDVTNLHYYAPVTISGPSIVCSSGASFTVNNLPTGATIVWSQGPNLTRTSAQGAHPCTFSATG